MRKPKKTPKRSRPPDMAAIRNAFTQIQVLAAQGAAPSVIWRIAEQGIKAANRH
jgi:hypothetical protein